jgi:hypothetical protein
VIERFNAIAGIPSHHDMTLQSELVPGSVGPGGGTVVDAGGGILADVVVLERGGTVVPFTGLTQ